MREPGCRLHEPLGDLRTARKQRGRSAWREAFRLAPSDRLRDKILKAERERTASSAYAFSAAPHFNLRFDGSVDDALADEIGDFLEEAWRELAELYRHTPEQPITVLLYPSQAFREVTQTPADVAGLFDGKIRVPWRAVAPEPAARACSCTSWARRRPCQDARNQPRWLQEGLAHGPGAATPPPPTAAR